MRTFTRLLSIAIVFMLLVTPKNSWSQTVWPGDVDNNGIVDGVDALYWNQVIGETGTPRINGTADWTGQNLPIPLWGTSFANSLDYSYADCDGNGVVDELDFMDGIIDNCGQTHGVVTPSVYFNGQVGVDPSLCLEPESNEVYSGEMLNIDLKLGDENIDIEDFKAITFTVEYDGEFVEDNSNFMLDLTESWADPSGTGEGTESYVKNYNDTNQGEVTILRTGSSIQNGAGKIGRVSIVIEDQIVGLITNDTMTVKVKNIKMVNQAGIAKRVAPDCHASVKILEPRNSTNCPQIVNPVCGDNGVTYINCCYAAAAGVTNFTTGVCYSGCIDETQMNPDANCSYTYNPVCGCNDVTYLNSCVAQANGVTVYNQGPCSENCYDPTYVEICGQTSTDPVSGVVNLLCPQTPAPVCGCDGITYTNSCYAQASGMSFYTPGPCANNCVDPNSMDPNLICSSTYDPVCGCNGVNYSNSCYADAAGVLNYTPGTCGSSTWCSQATPISCGDFMPNETTVGAGNNINSYPGCTSQNFAGPDKVYVINKNTSGDLQIGIEIMTPGMDLDMFLLTDNCNQVSCVKSSTTSNANSNNEGIIYEDAPIGTYYLVIDGQYANSEGNFRLEVNCGYLNCDNSVNLTCGVPVSLNNSAGTDEVSLYGCDGNVLNVENNGPEMIHTFTTTTAGPVNVSLYGLTANLELFMLRSCDRGDCIDYSQNPGTNNEQIEAYLQPGTYYVVVDGYNGAVCDYNLLVNCAANCTYDINATAMDANCGQNNGAINITSTGGEPGFIIQWSGPVSGSFSTYGTNCTVSGLPGGVYTVTATDANGCEDTSTVTIGNSETNLNVTATAHDAVCMDQGSISVSIANGSPHYQIFISGPTSGSTTTSLSGFNIVNLDPGTYTLQIVDANGCSNTQEVVIGQSPGNFNWAFTVTDAACGGTGSIHVVTSNGIPGYNIIVSGPTSGSATTNYATFNINNLPGGTYDITVEDGNWCQVTQTITIQDSNLTIGLDANSGYCGSTGSIDVNMSNGNPGYHIAWSGPSSGSANVGSSSYTIPNLAGGSYSVTVTDNAGCSDYQVVTLYNSQGSIDFDLTASNGSCGQAGSIWLGVNTGTSPFTITWSGPASGTITTPYTNYDIPWLPNGTYLVQVTDADGCSSTENVTINNSMNNLEINTTPSDGICGHPGSIWVSISNGTPGYSISWSGASSGSTTTNSGSYDIQNLAIGNYNITVTDGSGCQTTTSVSIGDTPSNLAITATPFDVVCGNPGSIDLAIANGAGGSYSIVWSGPTSGTSNSSLSVFTITGAIAGTYTIEVTDDNNCVASTTAVVVAQANDLAITGSPNNGVCGNPGTIDLNITGGTGDYTVAWSGAGSGSANSNGNAYTINNTVSGTYNITVTDAAGCTANTSIVVANGANNIFVTGTPNNGICGTAGSVDLTMSGGNGGYTVNWSGASTGTGNANNNTFTISNATSGNYNITVEDGNGCTTTTSVTVNNSTNNFSVTGTSADGTCNNPGSLWIYMDGGTPNYLVEWDGPVSGSAPTTAESYDVQGTPAGTYLVTVTDANGCVATTTIVVNNSAGNFSVTGTSADGTCNNPGSLWIYMDGGTPNYLVEWDGPVSGSAPTTAESYDVQGTPAGPYLVTVTDANGCVATTTIVVGTQGSDLTVTANATGGSCGSVGSILLSINGGNSPFTIDYTGAALGTATSNGGTYNLTSAVSGTYNFTVTDAEGCTATTSVIVNNNSNNAGLTLTPTNGACGQDGQISVTPSGTAPYTISWAGAGSGTATSNGSYIITNAVPGNYTISISDANGCTASQTTIVASGDNIIATSTSTGADCASGVGSIDIAVSAGSPSYTVVVAGPTPSTTSQFGNNFTISNVTAGTYSITITDAANCSTTITEVVAGSGCCMTASMTGVDAECGTNGSIWIDVFSGTPNYTVTWTGATSGSNTIGIDNFEIPNLPGGAYTVTVVGADGCTVTQNVAVNSTGGIAVSGVGVDGTCGGNGAATITVTGGAASYNVTWSGPTAGSNTYGSGVFTIPNLPVGNYTFTVTDGNGCTGTTAVQIGGGADNLSGTAIPTHASCESPLGSINVTLTGGTPGYTVVTTGPTASNTTQTGNAFTLGSLSPGSYSIAITDANGCSTTLNANVDGPGCCMSATLTGVNAECGQNGSIWIDVFNGAPNYTVTWTGATSGSNTIGIDNFEIPNLPGGTYTVTIEDANGCTVNQTVSVNSSGGITLTAAGNAGVCGGNGSANITVTGGTPSYTLTWTGATSGSNTYTAGSFNVPNLPAGSYTFSVTDGNGCTASQTVTVNSGANTLTATSSTAAADCTSGLGSVTIAVAGGTPGYTVVTTGPTAGTTTQNTGNFTLGSLAPGNYTISITDANGCATTLTALVGGPGCCMTANMTGVDATCGANGSIWIDVFNGAPNYTVTWTGPTSGSNTIGIDNFEIPNLPGGTYVVTVQGADGCSVTQTVVVNATGGVDVTLTPVDGDCGQNGSIWVDVNAGTPNFTVTWTGASTGSNTTNLLNFEIPNLPAGTYNITIVDANNCSTTNTVIVTTGAGTITATSTSIAATCATGSGSISVAVNGGTPGYIVTTTGPTSSTTTQNGNNFTLGGLTPGDYTISVADANGCTTALTNVVGEAGCCMTATMTGVDAGCGTNGSIWIDVFNGNPNYTVTWNGPSSGSNSINLDNFEIPNLPGGNYTVTITDADNCSVTQNVTINVTGSIDITATPIAGACGANGVVNVNILSGTPSFTVSWAGIVSGSNTTNANTYNIADLPAGVYTITVVDAAGCSDIQTVTVTSGANDLTATAVGGDVNCVTGLGQIAVAVANGAPVYTIAISGPSTGTVTSNTNGFNLTGLAPGDYVLTITDANGCTTTATASITAGVCCLTTTVVGVDGTCGDAGSIIVTSANGTGPYTYTWTGGGTATSANSPYTITGVVAGTYTVVVTDANNCSTTNTVTITSAPAVTFTATANAGACGAAGSVDLTILTGTPAYTIAWAGGSTTSTGGTTNIPNLAAGTYTFTVTDANNCTATQTVVVTTGTNVLSATAVGGNADCTSGLGQIAVTVANGTPGYTVTLVGPSPGTTNAATNGFNLTGLLPGNYTVTIVDANGCSTTVGTTVTDTACCMTTALTGVDGVCGADGSIIVSIANGAPGYTITWTGGISTTTTTSPYTITGVAAGTYTVVVTDANNCSTTNTVTITSTPAVTFTATANAGACGAAGSVDLTILTGTPAYTIAWAGGSTTSTGGTTNIPNLVAGTYTFTVTDANNCSATQTVTVTTSANNLTATAIGSGADCTS